jgi:hypothetical protein
MPCSQVFNWKVRDSSKVIEYQTFFLLRLLQEVFIGPHAPRPCCDELRRFPHSFAILTKTSRAPTARPWNAIVECVEMTEGSGQAKKTNNVVGHPSAE